ncbi:MAG: TolC family protein [Bryobacterales bacterium]|nr:TolC family protein [Bryobacterales bacterium]
MHLRFLLRGILLLGVSGWPASPQQEAAPAETLTLERALALALESNRNLQIARLEVRKAEDKLAAARTQRLPGLSLYTLGSQRITALDFRFPQGAFGTFSGIGPVPATDTTIRSPLKPAALVIGQIKQPLSQQYRIGLVLDQLRAERDAAAERERAQRQVVTADVKRVYFGILQLQSALESVEETIRLYREMDRVTGDYVVRQIALRADNLQVKTRLAKAEYDALVLQGPLETQKEQLNQLLGRDLLMAFQVAPVSEARWEETDLAEARRAALQRRPELREAALKLKQAEADRRVKKSEYIPDLSFSFSYFSPVNYGPLVPSNIAGVGLLLEWEPFDWGRKRRELAGKSRAVEQANLALIDAQTQVAIDVGNRFRKLREARQLLVTGRLARETATENLRVATNRYRQQTVLYKDVLEVQAALADANHQYQSALLAYWNARAEFEKALGEE